MEYQELIGSRRSIRFFDPKRQVEMEKIQKILEAMPGRLVCRQRALASRNSRET